MPKIIEILNNFSLFILNIIDPHMKMDNFLSTNHPLLSYLFLFFAFIAIPYIIVGKNTIIKVFSIIFLVGLFLFSILSGYTTSIKLSTSNYAMLENHALVVYVIIAIYLISFIAFLKQKLNCTISCLVAIIFAFVLVGSLVYTGVSIR